VTAAADGFHANAADVSSNNVPLNGGTYNTDGQTVAQALSTATGPLPPPPVIPLTPAAPSGGSGSSDGHHASVCCGPDPDVGSHQANEAHHHFAHMWG
jgi:hypothetical protein